MMLMRGKILFGNNAEKLEFAACHLQFFIQQLTALLLPVAFLHVIFQAYLLAKFANDDCCFVDTFPMTDSSKY